MTVSRLSQGSGGEEEHKSSCCSARLGSAAGHEGVNEPDRLGWLVTSCKVLDSRQIKSTQVKSSVSLFSLGGHCLPLLKQQEEDEEEEEEEGVHLQSRSNRLTRNKRSGQF